MKIYNSTEYIENPRVGDLQLKVNSMWDFGARSVCFMDINKSFGGGTKVISYDLEECIDVVDEKTTKWKQAEITPEIVNYLEEKGYCVDNEYKKIIPEIPQMKGTLEALNNITIAKK
jgi:hypothetical protein